MTAAVLATCSLVLCIRETLGKVTLRKYPSFRVPTAVIRCGGTLHVIFQRGGSHSFVFGTKLHRCTVGQSGSKEPDNQIPMVVIQPKCKLGCSKGELMEVKEELVKLGMTHWHNLNKCGSEHQYLLGLCTNTKMSQLRTKVEELIEPFVKNFIIKNYPNVNK